MDFSFLNDLTVFGALFVVVASIVLDAVLGMLRVLKNKVEEFDIRQMPRFVATNLLPYIGGLVSVAIVAVFVGQPYDLIFYPLALAVLAKYVVEIVDKLKDLFGIGLGV